VRHSQHFIRRFQPDIGLAQIQLIATDDGDQPEASDVPSDLQARQTPTVSACFESARDKTLPGD
jgi:hypothetical protein